MRTKAMAAKRKARSHHTERKPVRASTRRKRAQSSERRGGRVFRITVRRRSEFVTLRAHDVGRAGGIERIAGRTAAGRWHTQAYLISKDRAHIEDGRLVPDSPDAAKVLNKLGFSPRHLRGDRFAAADSPKVPKVRRGRAIGMAMETRRRSAQRK
jgi:hypothetical protein